MQKTIFSIIFLSLLTISSLARANDINVVKAFYSELLSKANTEVLEKNASNVITKDWVSIPTPRGGEGREGFVKTLNFFGDAIPDLKWKIEEILQDGNRYIVRSTATGTPTKPVLGIDPPTGKSFKIMTIDIHTVEDGKIVQTYHVEEWLKAKYQLTEQ